MDPRILNLPADAIKAIGQNNLIEAIKATRAATGLGLSEAKAAVEAYMAANPSAMQHSPANPEHRNPVAEHQGSVAAPGTGNLPAEAVLAISRGNLIEAIRITRAKTGLGLKEAKDAVDAYAGSNPGMRSSSAGKGTRMHALLVALLVMVVVAGIAGYVLVSAA